MKHFLFVIFMAALVCSTANTLLQSPEQHRSVKVAAQKKWQFLQNQQLLFLEEANNAASMDWIVSGDKGVLVFRAEILFDRVYFSFGEIGVVYGFNLRYALCGYEMAYWFLVMDELGLETWVVLNVDGVDVLIFYDI